MGFTSQIYPNEMVLEDDREYQALVDEQEKQIDDDGKPFGIPGRDWEKEPYGSMEFAAPFPPELEIPESDWPAIIQEKERTGTQLSQIIRSAGLPCKNQRNTNYCWIFAPTHSIEICRVLQNEQIVLLSPASAGARIKNFRNVGGWGTEGLRHLAEKGCNTIEQWPETAIDRKYNTAENIELALRNRVLEWWDLRPRNYKQYISLLLRNFPIPIGLNWWSHEVTAYDAVYVDGQVRPRIRNSWGMDWGDQGFSILTVQKGTPDDAVAPRVAIPTGNHGALASIMSSYPSAA